jgi:hypothetical protein
MAGKKSTNGSPSDGNQAARTAANRTKRIERMEKLVQRVAERKAKKGIVRGTARSNRRRAIQPKTPEFTTNDPVVLINEMNRLTKKD